MTDQRVVCLDSKQVCGAATCPTGYAAKTSAVTTPCAGDTDQGATCDFDGLRETELGGASPGVSPDLATCCDELTCTAPGVQAGYTITSDTGTTNTGLGAVTCNLLTHVGTAAVACSTAGSAFTFSGCVPRAACSTATCPTNFKSNTAVAASLCIGRDAVSAVTPIVEACQNAAADSAATCVETAATSVATDAASCAAVTALTDTTACSAVMTAADGAPAACTWSAAVVAADACSAERMQADYHGEITVASAPGNEWANRGIDCDGVAGSGVGQVGAQRCGGTCEYMYTDGLSCFFHSLPFLSFIFSDSPAHVTQTVTTRTTARSTLTAGETAATTWERRQRSPPQPWVTATWFRPARP